MRETCSDCGKTWGVTMTPRTAVRCGSCAKKLHDSCPINRANRAIRHLIWGPSEAVDPVGFADRRTSIADLHAAIRAVSAA